MYLTRFTLCIQSHAAGLSEECLAAPGSVGGEEGGRFICLLFLSRRTAGAIY